MVKILGIETSCDETSAAVSINGTIATNNIATQSIHKSYGGVVPELASRAHQKNIIPVVDVALKDAKISIRELDAIAYTRGPGLLGALMVGTSFAKSLALTLDIPIIPVNHMRAHILAHFIAPPHPQFPFLCLTVSGGHTQIVKVEGITKMTVLGETLDDAVGEAFDKIAKIIGLSYPGGPEIDKLAKKGDKNRFSFSEPEMNGYNFSFSGVKTAFLYFVQNHQQKNPHFIEENIHDLAASVQQTLINMLIQKLKKASINEKIQQIAIAGGVAANSQLRNVLHNLSTEMGWQVFMPDFQYCTDNAAMVAITGHFMFEKQSFGNFADSPLPRMPIE